MLERLLEQTTRRHVVAAGQDLQAAGWPWADTADFFHLAARTLRHWRQSQSLTTVPLLPLGRPIRAANRQERNDVIHFLDEWGPSIGLPTLQFLFPTLARAALADILDRYRWLWRRLHRLPIHLLHWSEVGRVWAVDFHGPRPPLDGFYPHLLAVRDLASHQQLAWLPVRDATAATLLPVLTCVGDHDLMKHGSQDAFFLLGRRCRMVPRVFPTPPQVQQTFLLLCGYHPPAVLARKQCVTCCHPSNDWGLKSPSCCETVANSGNGQGAALPSIPLVRTAS